MTMRYRPSGERLWSEGLTENISRSGVLFRAEHAVPERGAIEMLLALPVEVGGGENAIVICRGRVVRTEAPRPDDPRPVIAATITGYRLTHVHESDPRRI